MEHSVAHTIAHAVAAAAITGAKRDVQQRIVCCGGVRLALKEIRDARMGCEAEHVLRCVREGRGPEKLGKLCVEGGEDVEE